MANKREYTIVINGLKESYEGVKSLREALEGIDERLVQVEQTTEKTSQAQKTQTSSIDALAKAQDKLNNYDKEYQTELTKVNAQLSANKKEINEAIKLQQAQDIVDAKQLDTYKDKQTYLSALNTLIRNHTTATDADVQAIDKMVQESAALQAELKATDETMKIYVRNVGNYNEAADKVVESHKSVKSELKDLKNQMADMLANGVSKTDEAYLQLAERAGHLKDSIKDANEDITNFASDTRGMTNAINIASSAVNMWQLYNSAMAAFGVENEEAGESMKKMMAIMTLLNSLQQVQNSLLENGSATARLYSKAVDMISSYLGIKKTATEENIAATEASTLVEEANAAAQEANATAQETSAAAAEANTVSTTLNTTAEEANTVATGTNTGAVGTNSTALQANAAASNTATTATNTLSVAQKAGAVASNILSVALRAIPLLAIIGLVMTLIQNWESIWNWFKNTFPVLDTLSQKFKKFGGFMNSMITGAKAVYNAVKEFLISPFKTLAEVIKNVIAGDFGAAMDAAKNIFSNMGKAASNAFNSELTKGYERGAEERERIAAEEADEELQHRLNMNTKMKNADGTYNEQYIKDKQAVLDNQKKMYKEGSKEYNKVLEEEAQFHQQIEDAKTAATERAVKERTKANKKAADEAKKAADEYAKMIEKLIAETKKIIAESDKIVSDSNKAILKNEAETKKLVQNQSIYYKNELEKRNYALETLIKKEKETLEKAEREHNAWLAGLELTGGTDQMAIDQVKLWEKTLLEAKANLAVYNAELEVNKEKMKQYVATVAAANGRRKELMVQSLAEEGIALQETYQKALGNIANQMYEVENNMAEAAQKDKKKFQDQLDALKKRHDALLKSMQEQLGEYANQEIKIPVDIDTKGIVERYNQLADEMAAKGLPLKFNELQVTDMVLGFGNTFTDMFNKLAKNDALSEIADQFEFWAKQAKLTKEEVADAQKIINSGLPLDKIEGMLLELSDKFGQTKDDMKSVFDYIERNALKGSTLIETFKQIGQVAGLSDEKIQELEDTLKKGLSVEETEKAVMELLSNGQVNLKKFGELAFGTIKSINDANKELDEQIKKTWTDLIANADKTIKDVMLNIKRFQDATKEIKFEPVMDNDAFTRYFGGQILNIDKTQKRYTELKSSYNKYLESIKEGGAQMMIIEKSWNEKLDATKKLYGEDSYEYRKAVEDKRQALNVFVVEREKVSQEIKKIEDKESQLTRDYYESLEKQMKSVYSQLAENVFDPLYEGFGALLDYQLEEAQEALEEVEKLLDKATEARQESADRIKDINNQIKDSDASNRANLEQQLADEQVLLVQREEAERALEKEKKKRQYEVDMAEYNQRKFELGQKLIEGLVNTALGVTAALKYGPILGPIFAAIIGAMGALQTGIISKQIGNLKKPQKYATGGKVGEQGISRSHSQGGHRIEGTDIEVEGQEWVINKKSSDKYDDLLKAINEDNTILIRKEIENIHERRVYNKTPKSPVSRYANGGRLDTVNTVQSVQATSDVAAISELIRQIDFQPVVSVVDINKKQRNLTKVVDLAGKR